LRCQYCDTEIADKALICYRCGRATTEPRIKAPGAAPPRRRRLTLLLVVFVVLALLVALVALVGVSLRP
jgi:hypothetical protein